jgi:cell division protein FtsB
VTQQVNLGIWHRLTQLMMFLLFLSFLIGVFFWYLPLFQQNERMRKQTHLLDGKIKREEQVNRQLEAAINNLRNDPKTVERMVREKMGYAKPGETVIYFEPPKESLFLPLR